MSAAEGILNHVFISYSSSEEQLIGLIADKLKEYGLSIWYAPTDIKGGDSFPRKIEEGLRNSQIVITFLSQSAIDSFWVEAEWSARLVQMSKDRTRKLIPIIINDVQDDQIPLLLQPLNHLDFRNIDWGSPEQLHDKVNELIREIGGDLSPYAYRYRDEYPNGVIWINADQDTDAQLVDLAEKARWIAPESEHKYKLEIAKKRFRTYSDCLVIFDNLENLDAIENYLPEPQANPHILVTSRTEQPGFTPVPLDLLDSELSLKLLLQEAGPAQKPVGAEEEKAAREIAIALGGLPVALELAGAYIRNRDIGWQQYHSLLRQSIKAALPGKFLRGSFTKHETDLYSTLKINEETFFEEPRLKDILDLLTWSGSSPMGLSLMCALLDVANPAELTSALSLATSIRLLQKSVGIDSYSIHRLVAEVRREELPLPGREVWIREICRRMGDWFQQRKERFEELAVFEAEIDHLRIWQQHSLIYAQEQASRLTWLQAYPAIHRGRYKEIKGWVTKASELLEQFHVRDSQLEANLLEDHGFCSYMFGDYDRALEYSEKALNIRSELFGERHPDTAASFDNVGVVYARLGDYKRALEYQEKALRLRLEILGERHPDTGQSINNVAYSLLRVNRRSEALQLVDNALPKLKKGDPNYNLLLQLKERIFTRLPSLRS